MSSLFEQIAARTIPASIIREDDEFMAFLDIFPNCKGQTLVIPKARYDSDISLMPVDLYTRYMLAVQHVISLLKTWLGCNRVGVIMEWLWVNHAHVKLYPMHGVSSLREQGENHSEKVWFDAYPGYLTTLMGEMKQREELDIVAKEIVWGSVVS
jgi:histidine triad (HIT) family protein